MSLRSRRHFSRDSAVPAAAGGPTDIIARIIGQKLSETWGQQFVVENIPAGAGNVAAGMAAKATPDG